MSQANTLNTIGHFSKRSITQGSEFQKPADHPYSKLQNKGFTSSLEYINASGYKPATQ
jgi:hypothetical protein